MFTTDRNNDFKESLEPYTFMYTVKRDNREQNMIRRKKRELEKLFGATIVGFRFHEMPWRNQIEIAVLPADKTLDELREWYEYDQGPCPYIWITVPEIELPLPF